ncbi:tRNA1(Val) (adenine(37)-N6)-methyltransferase [Campylobacter suis]|uniref:tRNA1(Val) (Adenine(37)-N6)-methyltransferase n=1 Tax=Campylobacter suis TaxID=2790657 RepID=A0ABN7K3M2_9BACT|nr:methyltransferase [Campylobacter suis]CAD7287131.1 tRNA1(Val) (adenine(37)-N6)-methyltransferase [Campylobacter suis]
MRLAQLKNGYRYNSDTLVLYDFISSFQGLKHKVLDVGCGCGILGLLLKRDFPKIYLFGIDLQDINTKISIHNARLNTLEANFQTIDFRKFKSDERFENIVLNPPFYSEGALESTSEHLNLSRYAKHLKLDEFLSVANSHLTPNGTLYFCYESRAIDEIFIKFHTLKLKPTALKFVHSTNNEPSKLVLVKAQKNSHSKCTVLPPLFMQENGKHSKKAEEIFKRANTLSEDYDVKG